jgi:hypothetical protein
MSEAATPTKPAPYLVQLSRQCVERMDWLQLKGKRRDDAAIHFFVGAAQGLAYAGLADAANHVGTWNSMVLAYRGYSEVLRLANWVEPAA